MLLYHPYFPWGSACCTGIIRLAKNIIILRKKLHNQAFLNILVNIPYHPQRLPLSDSDTKGTWLNIKLSLRSLRSYSLISPIRSLFFSCDSVKTKNTWPSTVSLSRFSNRKAKLHAYRLLFHNYCTITQNRREPISYNH